MDLSMSCIYSWRQQTCLNPHAHSNTSTGMQEYIFSYGLQCIKCDTWPDGSTLIPGTVIKEVQSQGKGWEGKVTVEEEDTSNLTLPKTMTDIHIFLH